MNVFTATGNIGRDAETRFISSGEAVATVSKLIALRRGK